MLNPFLLMAVFYLIVAIVAAVDAALTSFTLLPWFVGLPWLRVHFITLGRFHGGGLWRAAGLCSSAARDDVAADALGHLAAPQCRAGGAAGWHPQHQRWLDHYRRHAGLYCRNPADSPVAQPGRRQGQGSGSLKFYVAGLVYLLVGILVGTGLWVGWNEPLRLGIPKEVHIHANSWGFASLVFAGLLIDLLPALTGAALASRRTLTAIFWAMTLGALGLVLGPWLGGNLFVTVPGLVLHIGATVWLLVVLVQALRRHGLFASAGAWHLVVSYVWILLPVLVAPLIILGVSGIPGADIEATAPQALIYGWMLQFLYAVAPYFMARWLLHDNAARLGGNWLSLVTVNLGSLLIWASIFLVDVRSPLYAIGYVLFGVSLVAAAWETGAIALAALHRAELLEV